MTELYCQIGKHKWDRPPTRGRVPLSCPKHSAKVVKKTKAKTKTKVKKTRTVKPKVIVPVEPVITEIESGSAWQPAKNGVWPKADAREAAIMTQVETMMDDPEVDPEVKRKLDFIQKSIESGAKREQHCINLLLKVRGDLLAGRKLYG